MRRHQQRGLRHRGLAVVAAGGLVVSGLVAASSAQAADNMGLYEILTGANKAAMLDTDPAPTLLPDPEGNSKELGPVNSNDTKLGVIHTAAVPMLALTNPNAQTDLRDIWLDTSTFPGDGDQYLYFAWERDSANGSGVLMIEFQHAPLSANCDYDAAGFDPDLCNPWAGRQAGDFVLVWDQQGQNIDIIKRTFEDVNGVLTLDAGVELTSAMAAVSTDGFFGEAAINLTEDVFGSAVDSCTTLANVIPGTVTGNSDQADYKDTVLAKAPPISNCGSVTVSKVTVPAGDTETTFTWTLDRADGSFINYDDDASASDTIKDGETDTVNDLIAAGNYELAETDPGPEYALDSIVCTPENGDPVDVTGDVDFAVVAGETTACVITNELQPGTLIVNKIVINDDGGTKTADDFSFTRNGGAADAFEADGSNSYSYPPNTSVDVVEVADAGYTTTYANSQDADTDCQDLVVPPGDSVTCTITNDDIAPTLTLVKVVNNDNGGTALATDWTLSAAGPTPISGTTGSAAVTNAAVDAGTYTLSESGGPADYSASDWVCVGGTQVDDQVTLALAESATCTITNDDAKSASSVLTTQSWILRDSASVTMLTGGTASTVTFTLFDSLADCEAYVADPDAGDPLWTSGAVAVTEGAGTGTADTYGVAPNGGYLATSPGTFFWLAEFSGNSYNDPSDSGCGQEITVINATDSGELPG